MHLEKGMRFCYTWFANHAVRQMLRFLAGQDLRGVAQKVMEELFRQLAMRYEFSLDGLLPPEKQKPVEEREETA